MKRISKTLSIVIIAVVAAVAVYFRISNSESTAKTRRQIIPLVKTSHPVRSTVRYTLEFTGDMVAARQANIFSKVSGNVEQVYVNIGSPVREGQLLALIDTTELYQQYQQAQATFQNTKLIYERTKQLSAQNLISKQDHDNAQAAMQVAEANFDGAATRLGYAHITAPFSGYITKRFLDPGAAVTSNNSTLFTLMDLDAMKVIVNILERDIPNVNTGTNAIITVDAFSGKEFLGRVTRFSQAVDPATRTMAVEIDIPNAGHLLKPGMFANVVLVTEEHPDALTLPTVSVMKDDKGPFIFAAIGDTARKIRIQTGIDQGDKTEILSGVSDSDRVITIGQQFVKDGSPVTIQS